VQCTGQVANGLRAAFATFAWSQWHAAPRVAGVTRHVLPAGAGFQQFITILATCALTAYPSAAVASTVGQMGPAAPGTDSSNRCDFAVEFAQSAGQSPASADCAQSEQQLVQALRAGGYVIYFRHGPTDQTQADTDPTNLANCDTQRNLTDAGRDQARAIGAAFRSLNIPVGTVLSSEYCRALEYSRLAFTTAVPEARLDLTDPLGDEQRGQSTATLIGLLGTPPDPATNTVLVSHSPNIKLAVLLDLPTEGEAAIFRVNAPGDSTLMATVLPTDWPKLAATEAPY
jgi:phosphohistidine phosphatase SixA